MNKMIVISTTFRDFTGGDNDKLQINFLRSLSRQTYQNFILVVSLFGEKNVENVVRKYLGNKSVFIDTIIHEGHRYSPTKTILNAIDYSIKINADILFDCSGDIEMENNFLYSIVKQYRPMYSGISHPNIFVEYSSSGKRLLSKGQTTRGIDARFFDVNIFKNDDAYNIIKNYTLYDWGGIEHLLFAVSFKYADSMINIYNLSKIIKTENDRKAVGESSEWIKKCRSYNNEILRRVALRIGIDISDLFDLYFIHYSYKNVFPQLINLKLFDPETYVRLNKKRIYNKRRVKKLFNL